MLERIQETFDSLSSRLTVMIWILASVVGGISGPFGLFSIMTLDQRLLVFTIITSIAILLSHAGYIVAKMFFDRDRFILQTLVGSCAACAMITPVIWWLRPLLVPFNPEVVPNIQVVAVYVATFGVPAAVLRILLAGALGESGVVRPAIGPPRLARRLQNGRSAKIYRITVRDHFVDVVTSHGSETLRMRFSDAVSEVDTLDGMNTHRSHWVAKAAVVGHEREGSRLFLVLINGDRVPVSRSYRPRVEEAGLLGD